MFGRILPVRSIAIPFRGFHNTVTTRIREVVTTENDKMITVEGTLKESPRTPYLLKPDPRIENNACILCQLNLDIKHTDVLILKQFVTEEGILVPRKITNLCLKQYRRIQQLVAMAQEAGLLGDFVTWEGKTVIADRVGFKKPNTYFDESTIKDKRTRKWMVKPKYH